MDKLPPIFNKSRFRIPKAKAPATVLWVRDDSTLPDHKALGKALEVNGTIDLMYYPNWWVEIDVIGVRYRQLEGDKISAMVFPKERSSIDGKTYTFEATDVRESLLALGGRKMDLLTTEGETALSMTVGALFLQVSHMIWRMSETPSHPSVETFLQAKPVAYGKRGDTIRYARLDSMATAVSRAVRREASGIRHREHDVRGFWRTYKSGVRVWVKPHRRGDPELGKVTRVILA